MSAQRIMEAELDDDEMLDAETSAALMRWLETAILPAGVDAEQWRRWVDGGCRLPLEADGRPVTPAMLGLWARTGTLG